MRKRTALTAAGLFAFGLIIGNATDDTVTKTVEVAAEPVVETTEVPVEVTPASCITALDLSSQGFSAVSSAMEAAKEFPVMVGEAWEAGVAQDLAAGQDILARMGAANDGVTAAGAQMPDLAAAKTAADDCRAKAAK